jgi:hypothetical protein
MAILINIATSSGNTMAWITATSIPWAYTRIGAMIGKLIPPKNPVSHWVKLLSPIRSIPRSIVPEVMFQKRRNAREMTFAMSQTKSRNHRKSETTISPIFATIMSG